MYYLIESISTHMDAKKVHESQIFYNMKQCFMYLLYISFISFILCILFDYTSTFVDLFHDIYVYIYMY